MHFQHKLVKMHAALFGNWCGVKKHVHQHVGAGEKKEIRARTVSALKAYSWPGNVRELEGVMARVLARTEAQFVEPEHLDDNIRFLGAETDSDFMENYKGMLERHEREHREFITSVLKRTGSLGKTAVVLDIPKPTLYSRAKLLGINNTNKKGV